MTNLDEGVTPEPQGDEVEATTTEETDLAAGEDVGAESEPTTEPEYDFLEVEDPSAKYVRVKVDGEEQVVPLSEALNGYSREADYTRKAQALAEQRQEAEYALRLAQAVQQNPGLTMQALAQQAGMSVQEFLGLSAAEQQQAAQDSTPEFDDPLEEKLYHLEQQNQQLMQRFEQQESDRVLQQAVGGLRQQGASEDDARAVVGYALNAGLGPQAFPMIWQAMQYQKLQAQQQAQQEHSAQRAATDEQRRAAAARATQVTGAGASAAGTRAVVPDKPMSIRDAFEVAWEGQQSA